MALCRHLVLDVGGVNGPISPLMEAGGGDHGGLNLGQVLDVGGVSGPISLLVEANGGDHNVLNLGQVLVLLVLVQQEVHSVVPEQQGVGT